MSSKKQRAANRNNAKASTGPKTAGGKRNVRLNALKHGLYAQEMIVRPEHRTEVEKLRRALQAQLLPKTPLQHIALKEITHCAWQCELGARLDLRRLNAGLDTADETEPPPDTNETPVMAGWFASSGQELRNGIRFLEHLKIEVERCGEVPAELKDQVGKGFGPAFLELLQQPESHMSPDTILLADHLIKHAAAFKKPLPPITRDGPEVIVEPEQRLRTIRKLIEQQQLFLETIRFMSDVGKGTTPAGVGDSPPRHFATASQGLHRAVDWFRHLVKNKL